MRSIQSRQLIITSSISLGALIASMTHAAPCRAERATLTTDGEPVRVEARSRAVLAKTLPALVASSLVTGDITRFGDGDTIVRFEQSHLGLPVIGRGVAVRTSARGQPIATVVDLEPREALPVEANTAISPEVAAKTASSRFAIGAASRDAHLIFWPTLDRGPRLAYAVVPAVPAGIPSAPRTIVDAKTGEVLEARDMITFAKATVYELNPMKTPATASLDLALTPSTEGAGASLTNPFLQASNCIDKKSVKQTTAFGAPLSLHVCDLEQVAKANSSGDFVYSPADAAGSAAARTDAFSEVSIYYHAAKAYSFFRGLQGDPNAQVVLDKPLRVVANLQIPAGLLSGNIAKAGDPNLPLEPFQNAFFAPAQGGLGGLFQQLYGFSSGALWFGQGPNRDYAYDGDVVYHEFGHAVVEATLKLGGWHVDPRGAIDAPGAMNEGLADYFSSAITGDPDVGEYAATDLGGGSVIRSLANEDRCPAALIGEVHFDSTVFSGALWQARQSLSSETDRRKFDAALYKAMRTNPGRSDLGFGDLITLMLTTLQTDLPAGGAALDAAAKARGLLPSCDRVRVLESGAVIRSAEKRIGFAAPGTQSVNIKGVAPGILQVRAALPANTGAVVVSFTARTGGAGGGGGARPFSPVVLAKLGAAITWDPKKGHDADATIDAKLAASGAGTTSVTIPVPAGATADAIYVQIANTGESDGAYDDVSVSFAARSDSGDPDDRDGDGVSDGAGARRQPVVTTVTESGCTLTKTTPVSSDGILWGVVGAAVAAVSRRRRAVRIA